MTIDDLHKTLLMVFSMALVRREYLVDVSHVVNRALKEGNRQYWTKGYVLIRDEVKINSKSRKFLKQGTIAKDNHTKEDKTAIIKQMSERSWTETRNDDGS